MPDQLRLVHKLVLVYGGHLWALVMAFGHSPVSFGPSKAFVHSWDEVLYTKCDLSTVSLQGIFLTTTGSSCPRAAACKQLVPVFSKHAFHRSICPKLTHM